MKWFYNVTTIINEIYVITHETDLISLNVIIDPDALLIYLLKICQSSSKCIVRRRLVIFHNLSLFIKCWYSLNISKTKHSLTQLCRLLGRYNAFRDVFKRLMMCMVSNESTDCYIVTFSLNIQFIYRIWSKTKCMMIKVSLKEILNHHNCDLNKCSLK